MTGLPTQGPNGQPSFLTVPEGIMHGGKPTFTLSEEFVPAHDLILVERLNTYEGNLVLPESAANQEQVAVVISTGIGGYSQNGLLIPNCVKAGDKIFLPEDPNLGIKFKMGGKNRILIRNHQVLGVFPETQKVQF